ncbi:MAG: carboxylating nicotinate-nucleotide diphosphorylase [Candidatus Omnitrophica bacterium]|nr:carboxylating nicotinate-nucleotide diphosphorylase [Candidatus Omnitrophota bacterium]MDD5592628.1 carboxylating nicotinate-nucleotide diphosphorylase [Candidatus Omnitrophota bacterium]
MDSKLDPVKLDAIIRHALIEDIGKGDITTQLTIPQDKEINAQLLVKEDCIICGLEVAERVFKMSDSSINFKPLAKEGQFVKKGKAAAGLSGRAGSILTAERVALNLLTMLSGIATKTREYVRQIEPYKTKISDTRKTIPGLRELQKYAVRVGGGHNHRMGLDEMILIKDNHIKVTEGYTKLPSVPKGFKIEIEAQNLEEFKHALKFKPDVIMLDNMGLKEIKEAVKIRNKTEFTSHHPPTKLEASGGVDFKSVKNIAAAGVDIISIGELTHSIKSVDISLEIL